jgi:hypothetical protein
MKPADMRDERFDLEALLPLALVREHTKTDDVPAVTDALIALYRLAALEAAEAYTGLMLSGRRVVTEDVRLPQTHVGGMRRHFIHRTKYQIAEPLAWFYGFAGGAPHQILATVEATEVRLPVLISDFGMGCCNPCSGSSGSKLMYSAGFSCADRVPAAFRLGALKYIAHAIENPGDLVATVNESGGTRQGGAGLTANNPALASGAIDIWRTMKADAV